MEKKGDYDSFMQAMAALNLPHKKADAKKSSTAQAKGDKEAPKPGKKQPITTNFDPNNKFHMIEVINLSGFAKKVNFIQFLLKYRNLIERPFVNSWTLLLI
jgi:hypothetical protein